MLKGFISLFSWSAPTAIASRFEMDGFRIGPYLAWFWQAKQFAPETKPSTLRGKVIQAIVGLGMLAQICMGIWLLIDWARFGTAGWLQFGLAALFSYPIVWANLAAVFVLLWKFAYYLARPKKLGRLVVCIILELQVRQLRKKFDFKVVAVVGSVGKTSTKLAIADLLSQSYRVRHQVGNYNDRVTVPLTFFGREEPNLLNVFAWLRLFRANALALRQTYPYQIVVVELGTDRPGFMREFAYVRPDITVVTAIAPEHMEFFKTLDAVAVEELAVFEFSKQVLVNADDIPGEYLAGREFVEYSVTSEQATYYAKPTSESLKGQKLDIVLPQGHVKTAQVQFIGRLGAKFALAAAAVADVLGMPHTEIKKGLGYLEHFSGRMQVLPGKLNATLIDDTYNASPIAVTAALDILYATKAKQRIAILGDMNELGDYSKEAHEVVGAYCDPKKLDLVVTIGHDSEQWLAPAAESRGCKVKCFTSPYEAGAFVADKLKRGAVVLAKGSQNRVFAEESLKILLADPDDSEKLVRQSGAWMKKKHDQFTRKP